MKKLFSLLFVVTLLFGSFVSPTFAANLPIVPTESKTTITIEKSENQSGVLKTDVQEVNIGVGHELIIKFENTPRTGYIKFNSLSYKSGDRYLTRMVNSKFDSSTGELKLSGIDWSKKGPYYGLAVVENHIYIIEINENDRNKTITIPYNIANFTKVAFELPQKSKVHTISVATLTSDNKEIANVVDQVNGKEYYIENGNYIFSLAGSNSDSTYKGYEGPINLNGGEKTVSIPESQFSKSSIFLDFKNPNAILNFISYCDYSVTISCSSHSALGKDFHYFSNGSYNSGTSTVKVGDFTYSFSLNQITFPSSNQVVIDDQIQSKIKFEDKVYKGGESVYLDSFENSNAYLTLKNKNGNKLMQVRNDLDRENYFGKLILKNNSEIYEVPLENSLSYAHVKLPNVSGTFEVTFTMGEGDNTPDKIRPDVSGTWADWTNSKGAVASNYTWTINLSGEANAATVTNNNIFVVDAEGYLVEGVQVKAVGKQILVSAPANGYEAGKSYKLYIRDAVKNAENKALEKTKMDFSIQK